MKNKKTQALSFWCIVGLCILLALLTVTSILTIQSSSSPESQVPFDLDQITARQSKERIDVSSLVQPAFIGITAEGERYGNSVSPNTLSALYSTVSPILSESLSDAYAVPGKEAQWTEAIAQPSSVYVRYHHALPDYLLHAVAGGNTAQKCVSSVYEMILLPYDAETNTVAVLTKDTEGAVTLYKKDGAEKIFTADDLVGLLNSYSSMLLPFTFSDSTHPEPVFSESLLTRNIVMTDGSAALLHNHESSLKAILRLFSLNPDKLLSRHVSEDGTGNYSDLSGIFYVHSSAFEYKAASEGGVPVQDYVPASATPTMGDYLQASLYLFRQIRAQNEHFTGGDADITLAGASSQNGRVTLWFDYTFDNLHIADAQPALTVTFENGRLTSALLYTLSVRNLGSRSESITEWWFEDYLKKHEQATPRNMTLVYPMDFLSDSVTAQWRGEVLAEVNP